MINLVDFSGKRIVVAGASSGIGRSTAVLLSQLGANVILIARREDQLKETCELMEPGEHSYFSFDLSQLGLIEDLAKKIVSDGAIDGLVYATGVSQGRPFAQAKPEFMQQVFEVNYFGFVELSRQLTKKGRFNAGMSIVGISSTAAICGDPALVAYSSTKTAMDGAVRVMAKELAPKGIRVNTVAPCMTNTIMYENYLRTYGEDSDSNRELLKRQYLGVPEPSDIANAIAFLLSSASRFVTGVCLPVDAGYTSN